MELQPPRDALTLRLDTYLVTRLRAVPSDAIRIVAPTRPDMDVVRLLWTNQFYEMALAIREPDRFYKETCT